MRVFISWSKPASQQMALVLRDWLPEVIQQISPWVSTEDIAKGKRWSAEIAAELDQTSQGLVCVTRTNMQEAWLNFEAGALAKSLDASQVRPVLLDLQQQEVTGPLAEFQSTLSSDQADMLRLVESLNAVCEPPLEPERLHRAFDRTWPDLVARLDEVRKTNVPKTPRGRAPEGVPVRTAEDMLGEVLVRIRSVEREFQRQRRGSGLPAVAASKLEKSEIADVIHAQLAAVGHRGPSRITIERDNSVFVEFRGGYPEDPAVLGSLMVPLRRLGVRTITFSSNGESGEKLETIELGGRPPSDE